MKPALFIASSRESTAQPAKEPLLERARRLERMGLLSVFPDSSELDITAAGRDIVGPIKAVADQV
jgi:hypothetical protein